MRQKLTKRQRIISCIIAFCVAASYVGFYFYTSAIEWAAKEGDRPPTPLWFHNISRDLILFPFGFVPAFGIWIFPLNILFWSTASVLIYVLFCNRKLAA